MTIKTFWPEDTADKIYITGELDLSLIIHLVEEKWGIDTDFNDIKISAEYIHTNAITYDLDVPSDYTNFTVITRERY